MKKKKRRKRKKCVVELFPKQEEKCFCRFGIFNPSKILWNCIALSQNSFVISPGLLYYLDATVDNLQTRHLRQILLFL